MVIRMPFPEAEFYARLLGFLRDSPVSYDPDLPAFLASDMSTEGASEWVITDAARALIDALQQMQATIEAKFDVDSAAEEITRLAGVAGISDKKKAASLRLSAAGQRFTGAAVELRHRSVEFFGKAGIHNFGADPVADLRGVLQAQNLVSYKASPGHSWTPSRPR